MLPGHVLAVACMFSSICPLFCRNLFCVETRTAARWLPRTFALDLADVHQIWCLTKEPLTIYVFGSWFLEQVWHDVNLGSVACRLIQRSRKSCPTFLLAGRMLVMLELANADKKLRLLCQVAWLVWRQNGHSKEVRPQVQLTKNSLPWRPCLWRTVLVVCLGHAVHCASGSQGRVLDPCGIWIRANEVINV